MTLDQLMAHVLSGGEVDVGPFAMRNHAPAFKCADGFTVSIQASEHHYCSPRENVTSYTAVELGFPSEAEPLLMEYAEDADEPTQTVYPYVPVDVVLQVINKHGGPA